MFSNPRRRLRLLTVVGCLCLGLVAGCKSAYERAQQAEADGDLDGAKTLYRQAMSDDLEVAEQARGELVRLMIEEGKEVAKSDPAGAIDIYEQALELDPQANKARLGIARILLRQGKQDQALNLLGAEGGCRGCDRLRAILLFERGQELMKEGQLKQARDDFQASFKVLEDALTALAIAETYAKGEASALAVESMEKAIPHIGSNADAQTKFVRLRGQLVIAAAKAKDEKLVDRYMSMNAPGAGGDPWFELQLLVAREFYVGGESNIAMRRLQEIVGGMADAMAPSRRKELTSALVGMYSIRAAKSLRGGDSAKAENDLFAASKLEPENSIIKLQRVLAIVELGKLEHAFRLANKLPDGTDGKREVFAILYSYQVAERLDAGDWDGALKSLELGQKIQGEMPEVHLAMARILVRTPVDGLPKGAEKKLAKNGVARYPGGTVYRFGEALSELDWARTQSEGLGDRYPWRGPATDAKIEALRAQIASKYPIEVKFQPEGTSVFVLKNDGARPLSVKVSGPGGFAADVAIGAGATSEVAIPEAGLVTITGGRGTTVVVAEPYTKSTLSI